MTEAPEKVWAKIWGGTGAYKIVLLHEPHLIEHSINHPANGTEWTMHEYVPAALLAAQIGGHRLSAKEATERLLENKKLQAEIARLRAQLDELGKAAVKEAGESGRQIGHLLADNDLLRAENERLKEALKPFALVAERDIGDDESDQDRFRPLSHNYAPHITVGHLRAARSALNGSEG